MAKGSTKDVRTASALTDWISGWTNGKLDFRVQLTNLVTNWNKIQNKPGKFPNSDYETDITNLQNEKRSKEVFLGAKNQNVNEYCKICTVELGTTSSSLHFELDLIVALDQRLRNEQIQFSALALSENNDPDIVFKQFRHGETSIDMGYVIESNAHPNVISVYIKTLHASVIPSIWLRSMVDNDSNITFESNVIYSTTEPNFIVYAEKRRITSS